MAKAAFVKRKELLTRKMSRTLKKRIIKTVIWSVTLYGTETWTLKKEDMKRLNSLEMWMWRRMERISWTERKTDEAVLSMVGEERTLLKVITQRKKNWIGEKKGEDRIPAEFWKALGDNALAELVEICKDMYRLDIWPTDFTLVVLIPLQKKIDAVDC